MAAKFWIIRESWTIPLRGVNTSEVPTLPESLSWDPQGKSLHARGRLYMDNPPQMTYDILKRIVSTLKKVGAELLVGKKIRVGETFDIGPEFARSSFKYERHTELLRGTAMGAKCFIDSNGTLQGDDYPYAGFPNGVPDGTPFGTIFGSPNKPLSA